MWLKFEILRRTFVTEPKSENFVTCCSIKSQLFFSRYLRFFYKQARGINENVLYHACELNTS